MSMPRSVAVVVAETEPHAFEDCAPASLAPACCWRGSLSCRRQGAQHDPRPPSILLSPWSAAAALRLLCPPTLPPCHPRKSTQ
eukprot:5866118-Pyramimonas_sp.AAC.1